MGFVLLGGLSALAAVAALALTVRARPRTRAEGLVAITLLWNAIVVTPIYVLGLLGRLSRTSLGVGSLMTSLLVLALCTRGMGVAALSRETWRALRGQLRLPVDALILTWRERILVLVGVAATVLLLPYLALSAYLAQPFPHWDPLWYHDTIVGFTIQNHGFAMVDLPPTLQKVNGYVRLAEMTQLWLVIFTDRRLADLTNLLFAPAIAASVYALARRYADPVIALGWGVAIVLMPACSNLLQTTFVDPQNAALLLGGILFATVDPPRIRDTWLAALGLALAIGSKGLSLIPVPVAALIAAVLLLHAEWHRRRGAAVATVVGGGVLILAVASTTYLRNYLAFHNPFWPDMKLDVNALGIHWPGQLPWSVDSPGRHGGVDVNMPLLDFLRALFVCPWTVKGMEVEEMFDFGIGIEWVAIPLGVVAFIACLVSAIRRRTQTARTGPPPPLAIALILAVVVTATPALWGARYHSSTVGLLAVLNGWFLGAPTRRRLAESAVSVVLVTSVMMFLGVPAPRWWFTPAQLLAHARAAPIEREIDPALGAPTTREVGLAREKELGAGSLLVFTDRYAAFPALFWNNTYSNRIMYLRGGPDFLARAARAGATWIYLVDRTAEAAAARGPGSGWQPVGALNAINGGMAFRRVP